MSSPPNNVPVSDDEEDDYMNMTFEEPTPAKETSLQRTQRLKKEALARGMVKSKAQLLEEEAAAREKALSTSMLDGPAAKKSKGFAMMAKMGFTGGGLGKTTQEGGEARKITEPIKLSLKEDRGGIGMESEKKRKLQEAMEEREVKTVKLVDPYEYRDRIRKEREDERLEKQFQAAQRVAERMDEEESTEAAAAQEDAGESVKKVVPLSSRPLKSIPVLYRGLVRYREEKERDRRMRHDLEQSLTRLPTYDDEDETEDDKRALGKKTKAVYVTAEDLDDEDEELEAFNAQEPGKRLGELVGYLRRRHWYCFWCKMQYNSEDMEGCPGTSEEDHD
ncbi:hypothetical protein E4U17_007257 [Claviceps sp. LM77 group G4]|nr:hypothetical protein E4U17_007257 [Claviceps sp. LM77 group G4]KAG6083763.1 hypothetical protein E4U16_003468 [Claviceps sp. LM84 group G4]KAG6084939.1 hypothetical protein E4U33_002624 [Claviceps sp. LM78 group G4]